MSLIRTCSRITRLSREVSVIPSLVRFNSTSKPEQQQKQRSSLLAEIYPINKEKITEQDLNSWSKAVKELKNGKKLRETPEEIYLGQLAQPEQFLKNTFEPTTEQIEQVQKYANKQIPLRSDPTVDNLTNLIMRHGKKAKAQKIVSRAFYIIQLKLRQDPIEVWKETLDKLGPLVHTKTISTGVAKKRIVPLPLNEKQRNRYAIKWILEASDSKKSNDFAVRLAEEIINAYQGKSSGYDKKAQMHKQATQQRAYITL